MTREDIIRMAREAGGADISMNGWTSWVGTQSTDFLERFAKLVSEYERNRLHDKFMAMHEAQKHSNNYWHFAARQIKENT